MSDTAYSRWYREGTIAVTQNSKIITGTNTYWLNINLKPGDLFTLNASQFFEIDTVDSNTQITLKTPYTGESGTQKTYAIIRNFTATMPAEIAAMAADILAKHERYIDEDMKTVEGKSAYTIAKEKGFTGTESEWLETLTAYGVAVKNGYTGTAAQWLEDLKAAGEWTQLNTRTTELETTAADLETRTGSNEDNITSLDKRTDVFVSYTKTVSTDYSNAAGLHNSMYRGKFLGNEITDAQYNAIQNGSFDDIYPGDYWDIPIPEKYNKNNFASFIPEWNEEHPEAPLATGFGLLNNYTSIRWIVLDCNYHKGMEHYTNSWKNQAESYNKWSRYEDTPFYGAEFSKYYRKNHLVIAPMQNLMYSINGNTALANGYDYYVGTTAYAGSNLRLHGLKLARQIVKEIFGEEHLYKWVTITASTTDSKNNLTGSEMLMMHGAGELPSEIMISGSHTYGAPCTWNWFADTSPYYESPRQFAALQKLYEPMFTFCTTTTSTPSGLHPGQWVRTAHGITIPGESYYSQEANKDKRYNFYITPYVCIGKF